jgi:purine-binding chemotaxis protein CheW
MNDAAIKEIVEPAAPQNASGKKDGAAILRERARILAKETVRNKLDGSTIDVVEFLIASEHYGIESSYVREVCPLRNLTPVPCTPAFVLGIINIHGQILSVIDLRRFFEIPGEQLSDLNRVIVLHSEEMEFGVLADAILGLRSIETERMQTSLPTLTDMRADFFKGVTGDRTVILDGSRILSDPRIIVSEETDRSFRSSRV